MRIGYLPCVRICGGFARETRRKLGTTLRKNRLGKVGGIRIPLAWAYCFQQANKPSVVELMDIPVLRIVEYLGLFRPHIPPKCFQQFLVLVRKQCHGFKLHVWLLHLSYRVERGTPWRSILVGGPAILCIRYANEYSGRRCG